MPERFRFGELRGVWTNELFENVSGGGKYPCRQHLIRNAVSPNCLFENIAERRSHC